MLLLSILPGATADDVDGNSTAVVDNLCSDLVPVACEAKLDGSAACTVKKCEIVLRTPVHQQAATVCVIYPPPGLILL